jgi:N-ethylmaleimide reductase
MQPDNELPVAPSAIAPVGELFTEFGMKNFVTPRALSVAEIRLLVQHFDAAARLALEAGFDGVDLHAANGYLLDQFLRDGSNRRTDQYGGSIRNRARFLLEVVEAVSGIWGVDRVGVRLSPLNRYNTMHDSEPLALSSYLAGVLGHMNIGYLHVIEPGPGHPNASAAGCELLRVIRERFAGCFIVDGGRDRVSAEAAVSVAGADLVALATPFIANPDLVERLARGLTLAIPDPDTFYTAGERGYTDYPTYPAELKPLPITGRSVPRRRAASPEAL